MKLIKISIYAIFYLFLCLIIMPIIVNILIYLTGLESISNMLSVFIKIILALQISKQINKVTQIFPNYLNKKDFKVKNTKSAQTFWYVVYFSLIFLMSKTLTILNLSTNTLALIITTLLKLLITYLIANIIRYIVYIRKN